MKRASRGPPDHHGHRPRGRGHGHRGRRPAGRRAWLARTGRRRTPNPDRSGWRPASGAWPCIRRPRGCRLVSRWRVNWPLTPATAFWTLPSDLGAFTMEHKTLTGIRSEQRPQSRICSRNRDRPELGHPDDLARLTQAPDRGSSRRPPGPRGWRAECRPNGPNPAGPSPGARRPAGSYPRAVRDQGGAACPSPTWRNWTTSSAASC